MERRVGTVSRGIRCGIIREGDNLVDIAVESVLEGTGARLLCAPPLGLLEVKVERACCRSS